MGWPVAHSLSPRLHGYWLKKYGIEGGYEALAVEPEKLEKALRDLPKQGFRGVNLTIPHKEAALAIVDRLDPMARRIGAVNTVVVRSDGKLEGRNTDVFGFTQNLLAAHVTCEGKTGNRSWRRTARRGRWSWLCRIWGAEEIRVAINRTMEPAEALKSELRGI